MKSFLLFLVQLTFKIIPDTKGFSYKRWALRLAGANIGRNVRICSSVRVMGNSTLSIGDNTWIGHGAWIICSAPVSIGSNVNIAPLCYIGTGTHSIDTLGDSVAGQGVSKPIVIGNGAWVCVRSTILPGVTIGEMAILASGSIARTDVMDRTLFGGVPAKMIKILE